VGIQLQRLWADWGSSSTGSTFLEREGGRKAATTSSSQPTVILA